jgi:hypothetical protein
MPIGKVQGIWMIFLHNSICATAVFCELKVNNFVAQILKSNDLQQVNLAEIARDENHVKP